MKQKIFLILLLTVILIFAKYNTVSAIVSAQQMEILKHEISLLKSLISNYNLRQSIGALSYVAVDLSDNSVLLKKNADKTYPIASITKLMNAIVASENIKIDQTITLTKKMLEPLGQSPALFEGLEISAGDLLNASLIQSTNDAAQALSYFIGNEKFLEIMNQKAKKLDMKDTAYYDVHGLNYKNKSTALDLAKLVSYIYQQHPEILNITKNNSFWLANSNGTLLKFQNVNNFYYLNDFIGGKTGYLPEAKQTFASVFNVNGKPIAITLLSSKNRMADIFNILRQLKN